MLQDDVVGVADITAEEHTGREKDGVGVVSGR